MATNVQLHDWAHAFFGIIKPLLPALNKTESEAMSDLVFNDCGLLMPDVQADTLVVRLLEQGFIETTGPCGAHAYGEVRTFVDPMHPERGLMITPDEEEPHLFNVAFFNYEL